MVVLSGGAMVKQRFVKFLSQAVSRLYFRDIKHTNQVYRFLGRIGAKGLIKECLAQGCFLAGSRVVLTSPRSVRFEVSSLCNLKCLMCPQPTIMSRRKQLMDIDIYKNALDANSQIEEVDLFNWGEPLIHHKFEEFVSYASSKGLFTRTVTNGTLLTKDRSRKIIDSGISEIIFSVDSVGENYYKIRGVEIEETINKIENFIILSNSRKNDICIGINITNSVYNSDCEKSLRYFLSLGVDYVAVNSCHEYSSSFVRKNSCLEPYRYIVVLSDGTVTPCCADFDGKLAFGSLYEEINLDKLINNSTIQKLRQDLRNSKTMPQVCSTCSFRVVFDGTAPVSQLFFP